MKILIADDETPARGELRYILESLAPESKICEAANGTEALALVESESFDVIFLDIHMPGIDGLAVASTIMEEPEPPLIVFATAYDEHALRAFELAALDYVMKPFDERRLARTMERIQQAFDERSLLSEKQNIMRNYLRQLSPANELKKLWGERANQNRLLVNYEDVLWVMAENKDVFIHTATGEKLRVRYTIKELEPRLVRNRFSRVHRAYLVNLDHIAEVVPWFSGNYLIRMKDETRTEIPMSRRYAAQLKQLTEWR
jgi:two-component system response regulator LytT